MTNVYCVTIRFEDHELRFEDHETANRYIVASNIEQAIDYLRVECRRHAAVVIAAVLLGPVEFAIAVDDRGLEGTPGSK